MSTMTRTDFVTMVTAVFPEAEIREDDGELVIYSGLAEHEYYSDQIIVADRVTGWEDPTYV